MVESKRYSPDGWAAGGFVVRGEDIRDLHVALAVRNCNVLEIVDALCGAAGVSWSLDEYAIVISKKSANPGRK